MASKNSGQRTVAKSLTIKFVKKAKMWCATYPLNGKTAQEWFTEKPTGEQIDKINESMEQQ